MIVAAPIRHKWHELASVSEQTFRSRAHTFCCHWVCSFVSNEPGSGHARSAEVEGLGAALLGDSGAVGVDGTQQLDGGALDRTRGGWGDAPTPPTDRTTMEIKQRNGGVDFGWLRVEFLTYHPQRPWT